MLADQACTLYAPQKYINIGLGEGIEKQESWGAWNDKVNTRKKKEKEKNHLGLNVSAVLWILFQWQQAMGTCG